MVVILVQLSTVTMLIEVREIWSCGEAISGEVLRLDREVTGMAAQIAWTDDVSTRAFNT